MRHLWTIFCRTFLEDKRTNNLSLIEVTESIAFGGELAGAERVDLPLSPPFNLVSSWRREAANESKSIKARVRFVSPDGETLIELDHDVEFGENEKTRAIGHFGSLPYTVNGVYEFEVSFEENGQWTPVAHLPLEITCDEPEKGDSEPGS